MAALPHERIDKTSTSQQTCVNEPVAQAGRGHTPKLAEDAVQAHREVAQTWSGNDEKLDVHIA